jgi:hypothetical protein
MAEKTREQRIKAEKSRLRKLCKDLPENKKAIALPLVEQAAFMRITLDDLQEEINEAGCVEEYQNGRNQSGFKTTAALQAYNSTVKNYAAVCERLDRILPASSVGSKLKALMAYD